MKKQIKKQRIMLLLPIGLLCISLAMMLNHFNIIGDGVNGFLTGLGAGLEFLALIKAAKHRQCDSQLT